jgi:hypothetical protein
MSVPLIALVQALSQAAEIDQCTLMKGGETLVAPHGRKPPFSIGPALARPVRLSKHRLLMAPRSTASYRRHPLYSSGT